VSPRPLIFMDPIEIPIEFYLLGGAAAAVRGCGAGARREPARGVSPLIVIDSIEILIEL
jgi:hypothetical protein